MRKRILPLLFVLFILCSPWVIGEEQKTDKVFLWKISSDNTVVYLLGSLHLFKPELYPLDKAITEAYEKSDVLAVEADISPDNQMKVQQLIMQKGVYMDGTTIKDHVSETTYSKLKKEMEAIGLNMDQLAMMKHWLLSLQLEAMTMQKLGFLPEGGIDNHFLARSKKDKKPIKELESLEFQIDLLSSFPNDLQEKNLINTLDELSNKEELFNKILRAWLSGDMKAMREATFSNFKKNPELKPVFDKLFSERDINMASKIHEYLKSGKTHFVVVGSGHIAGDKGILYHLRKKDEKYSIEQVEALGKPVPEEEALSID